MDWFLYDDGLRHERVNILHTMMNHRGRYLFELNLWQWIVLLYHGKRQWQPTKVCAEAAL